MRNCLVTGGGGFLGEALVRMLRERGDSVAVLARRRYPSVEALGAVSVQADVTDRAAVLDACRGRDVVFHVAAKAGIWGPAAEYEAINVGGTANVLEGCRAAGVPVLVHTSTPSAVYAVGDLCGVDESIPYPSGFETAYARTKAQAERMVLEAHGQGLSTVALRPHLIYGPGDNHLIPRVLQRAREGRLFRVGDGRNLVDLTYVDNAAEAHLLAAERPTGKAYFLSNGDPVNLWEWLNDLLRRVDLPPVRRSVPYGVARVLGLVLETVYSVLRLPGEPRMTRFLASQLATSHWFDLSAARRDLGYEPRISNEEGTRRLADWIRSSRSPS